MAFAVLLCPQLTLEPYLFLVPSKLPFPLIAELFDDSPNFLVLRCTPRLEFFPHVPSISAHLNHTCFYKPISNVTLSENIPPYLSFIQDEPQSTGASQGFFWLISCLCNRYQWVSVRACVHAGAGGELEGGKLSLL